MVHALRGSLARAEVTFFLSACTIALASRIMLFFANWYTLAVLPMVPNFNPGIPDSYLPDHKWLDGWARWDSAHYIMIATEGYGEPTPEGEGRGIGFFPAFPIAMRMGAWLLGDSSDPRKAAIAGIAIANVCFLIAVLLLAAITRKYHDDPIALTSVVLFSFSPVSFFFSAVYTESLFVMAVLGTFFLAERGQWVASSLMMALASATRLFGLVLIPAVLYIAWKRKEPLRTYLPVVLISPLGTIGYFAWLWHRYGDPLGYFNAQSNWGDWQVRVGTYITQLWNAPFGTVTDPMRTVIVLYVAIAVAFAATLPFAWKASSRAIAGFSSFMVLFHLVYTWNSLGRYMLPALGCFIGLAWALHQPRCPSWVRETLFSVSAILMTTFSVLYAHGYWII